jgi:hypothetical protein
MLKVETHEVDSRLDRHAHRGQAMRLPRTQFTVRRIMITTALVSLLLAIFMYRERIRRVNQMVINQDITRESAKANFMNAVLAREAAEYALGQYSEKHHEPRADVPRSETSRARLSADQSRLVAKHGAELASAEDVVARTIRQLDEGTYTNAGLASQAAVTALRHYIKTLENHLAATQASQIAGAQGSLEMTRITLKGKVEEARGQERLKKVIWDYEKALRNSLRRERTNLWW